MTAQATETTEESEIVSGTEAWHRARHTTLGASDRAAAMGLSRWKTRSDLAEEKIAPFKMPEEATGALRRGIILERPAALAWQAMRPECIGMQDMPYGIDAVYSWMSATPDRLIYDETEGQRLLEIKTCLAWKRHEFGEAGSADIPVEILLQVQQQMAVTGVHSVEVFAVFAEDQAFRLLVSMHDQGATDEQIAVHIENTLDCVSFFVEFDQELEDDCMPVLEEFWHEYVEKGIVPPNIQTMQHLDGMVQANEVQELEAESYRLHWLIIKKAERELERLRTQLENAIGEQEGIETSAGKITWRKCKDTVEEVTDWEGMCRAVFDRLVATQGRLPVFEFERWAQKFTKDHTARQGTRKFLVPSRKWEQDL